jgi:hypothetical protein
MKTTIKNCDCEICLYKTTALDTPLVSDEKKIINAIIYHYIVRLSSLVKTRKDLNSYIIKFIVTINPSYLENCNNIDKLKETINVTYKSLTDLGKCCRFSSNASLTKLTHKEANYLKLIINSMEEEIKNEIKEEIKEEDKVISPIKIIVDEVIEDVKKIAEDVKTIVDDIKTLAEDVKPAMEGFILMESKETIPQAQDVSGSYYSYCVIS